MLGYQNGFAIDVLCDALDYQRSARRRHLKKQSVGFSHQRRSDGLSSTSNLHRQQFVEAGPFNVGLRELGAEVFTTPHRDPRERYAVGEIDSTSFQNAIAKERSDVGLGLDELKFDDTALGHTARVGKLSLDRGQTDKCLRKSFRGNKPTEPLPCVYQSFASEQFQGLADRDSTRPIRRAQFCLTRQDLASRKLTSCKPRAQIFRDLVIANCPHLY